jgi:glycosyltransferase involved in cell wall biosynthesis
MALWMDMTHSLKIWSGGVVGIVRAELEVAKNLKKIHPDIRFSMYNETKFEEIPADKLGWLFENENVTEAYFSAMGRTHNSTDVNNPAPDESLTPENYPALYHCYNYSANRVKRFIKAGHLFSEKMPLAARPFVWLLWLIAAIPFTVSAVLTFVVKRLVKPFKHRNTAKNGTPAKDIVHPYAPGDKIFSMGWITSDKEDAFSRLKDQSNGISLIYLIYDIILLNEQTRQFYSPLLIEPFRKYYEWCLSNCDYLLYGGENTQNDSEKYQQKYEIPITPGISIRFGSNVLDQSGNTTIDEIKEKYKICGKYIITVGSFDPRKNYDTLYRAYALLDEEYGDNKFPQLVIVGSAKSFAGDNYYIEDIIKADPKTRTMIIIIQPTDTELDLLYRNSDFVIVPSLYEGWSLTLPEALSYGKFTIAVDVPPIREIGTNLVKYISEMDAQNPVVWADTLSFYFNNPSKYAEFEQKIKIEFKSLSWLDCTKQIDQSIANFEPRHTERSVWFDLTLTVSAMFAGNNITGILRSELLILRNISKLHKNIRYFALIEQGCIVIPRTAVQSLLGSDLIDYAYWDAKPCLLTYVYEILSKKAYNYPQLDDAIWMLISVFPNKFKKLLIRKGQQCKHKNEITPEKEPLFPPSTCELVLPFKQDDIVFSAGIGGIPSKLQQLITARKQIKFKYMQLMYDFTPMLTPQTHQEETIRRYKQWTHFVAYISDVILYGGVIAMRDGEDYLRKSKLPVPQGYPLKLGGNIKPKGAAVNKKREQALLKELDLENDFIITVGTWEYRKNHTVLYHAYLRLLAEGYKDDIPQLVLAGRPGWKTEHLIRQIRNDTRLKDKIVLRTPSDEQLDVLYKYCKFTLLPSIYEGWSLTLPEALGYGKFCVASNVDPIRETGGQFCDYVHPYDVTGWAEKILFYATRQAELRMRERQIADDYVFVTWVDCAVEVYKHIEELLTGNGY